MKLDSFSAVVEWLGAILTEIVTGIRNTYLYWNHRKDDLKDLTKE